MTPDAGEGLKRSMSNTFASQATLPRLPIPTLEETLEKFPKCVEAIQTPEQREATKEVVKDFLENDGPKLQALLEKYDEEGRQSGEIGSYIEEFWNESYLAPDSSVVLNLNPFFVLEEGPDPKIAKDQIRRAASLTFAAVKLASLLKHETLKPDIFRGKTLDMDQFRSLFGSCRYPELHSRDTVNLYPESTHVAVMCRNQVYYFQALWEEGLVAVDENDIIHILQAIQQSSASVTQEDAEKTSLGVLTSLPRKEWAQIRSNMVASSENNAESLHIIDSALFVLVLDDYTPQDANETASNMLHGTYKLKEKGNLEFYQAGTCCNRWYDKLQLICMADGTTGVNFEHSAIDGHTALRFVSDIFSETVVAFAQSITKLIYGAGRLPNVIEAEIKRANVTLDASGKPLLDVCPKKLLFDLPKNVIDRIRFAEAALGDQIVSCENVVLEFKSYGKKLITANKLSPDSFVQMSMVLAYYNLYGKAVCTYEPVMTKSFYHGRTEAMRTMTSEAAEFCRVWNSNYTTKEDKMEALKKATVEHSRLVKEAANGKGADRHLFALQCIAEKNDIPLPSFFHSEAWKMLNYTVLSTSNCGNPSLRLFGFGPVVQDGFGIGYIIKDHGLQYSVSSKHRQTQRYVASLEKTLLELQDLMDPEETILVNKHTHHSLVPVKSVSEFKVLTEAVKEYPKPTEVAGSYLSLYGEGDSEGPEQILVQEDIDAVPHIIPPMSRDGKDGDVLAIVKPRKMKLSGKSSRLIKVESFGYAMEKSDGQ